MIPAFAVADFNPIVGHVWRSYESITPRHLTSYAEAYKSGGEFVLVIGSEAVAKTLLEVVSCPVAREDSLANKPAGIYRVFDGSDGKKIAPWASTDDVIADRYQRPAARLPAKADKPAIQSAQPLWQRVCTPQGCQWIKIQ